MQSGEEQNNRKEHEEDIVEAECSGSKQERKKRKFNVYICWIC